MRYSGKPGRPTIVLIDEPHIVEQLKPLLKEQGYKVLAVAVIHNSLQDAYADIQEEARQHFKQALKEGGEAAAEGLSPGVHYKFRIRSAEDVAKLWDVLREEAAKLPKENEMRGIVIGSQYLEESHLLTQNSRCTLVDELLAATRPPHFLPKAPMFINFSNGQRYDNIVAGESMLQCVATYRGYPNQVKLLSHSLLDKVPMNGEARLNPQALMQLAATIDGAGDRPLA